jgi:predicted RNase H-like nuclease (RuvC/YqgF family)
MIDTINQLKREIAEEREGKDELKEQIRELRRMMKEGKNTIIHNPSNKEGLGQKVDITIDRSNPYLSKYCLTDNLL